MTFGTPGSTGYEVAHSIVTWGEKTMLAPVVLLKDEEGETLTLPTAAQLPSSLGIKTAAASLSVAPASDGLFRTTLLDDSGTPRSMTFMLPHTTLADGASYAMPVAAMCSLHYSGSNRYTPWEGTAAGEAMVASVALGEVDDAAWDGVAANASVIALLKAAVLHLGTIADNTTSP